MSESSLKSLIVPGLLLGTAAFFFLSSEGEAKAGTSGGGGAAPPPKPVPPIGGGDQTAPPGKEKAAPDENGIYPTNDGTQWATPGKRSNPLYQWLYPIPAGHTGPAQLAKRVTGDERRYKELFAANPTKAIVVTDKTNFFGTNFATWNAGERIRLPKTWNQFVDEAGNINKPDGTPFPA